MCRNKLLISHAGRAGFYTTVFKVVLRFDNKGFASTISALASDWNMDKIFNSIDSRKQDNDNCVKFTLTHSEAGPVKLQDFYHCV